MDTATAIPEHRLHRVDLAAVAEEIEDLGKSERRALFSAVQHPSFKPMLTDQEFI